MSWLWPTSEERAKLRRAGVSTEVRQYNQSFRKGDFMSFQLLLDDFHR